MGKSQTERYITMHIKLDKSYAAALDVIGERLGVNRSQLFEAGVKCIAERIGVADLPRRLPAPAEDCYQSLKVG